MPKELWNLTQAGEFDAAGANGTESLRDFMQRLADIADRSSVRRRTRAKEPIYTSKKDVGTQKLAELQEADLVAQGFTSEAAKLQQQYDESCDDDTDPFVPLTGHGFVVPQSLSEERDQSLEDSKKLEEEDEEDLPPMKRRRALEPSKKIMSLEKDEEDLPPIRIGLPPKREWQERYRRTARGPD